MFLPRKIDLNLVSDANQHRHNHDDARSHVWRSSVFPCADKSNDVPEPHRHGFMLQHPNVDDQTSVGLRPWSQTDERTSQSLIAVRQAFSPAA